MENGTTSEYWKSLEQKFVRVIIDDKSSNYPTYKDGVVIDVDATHLFLEINNEVKPILRTTIRRVDIK